MVRNCLDRYTKPNVSKALIFELKVYFFATTGGIHDQGWGERPIFGKIRFMNYQVLFPLHQLIECIPPLFALPVGAAIGELVNLVNSLSLFHLSLQGCKRKFDVQKFVSRYPPAAANANSSGSNASGSNASGSAKKAVAVKGQKGIDSFLTKK